MSSRWREENYFRYARAHFALDALDTYAASPPKTPVPGWCRTRPRKPRPPPSAPRRNTSPRAEAARQRKLDALRQPAPGTAVAITNQALARLYAPVNAARRDLAAAQAGGLPVS